MSDAVRAAVRLFPATEFSGARAVTRPSTIFRHSGTSSLLAEEAKIESCKMGEKEPDSNKGDRYSHVEDRPTVKVQGLSSEPAEDAACTRDEINLLWNQYTVVEEPSLSVRQGLPIGTCKAYRDSSEADFEWPSLEDKKGVPNPKLLAVAELKDGRRENATESGVLDDAIMVDPKSFITESVVSRSSAEDHSIVGSNHLYNECKGGGTTIKCSSHGDVRQQSADDNNRAAPLTSRRYYAYFENCDLPPSQSIFAWKGPSTKSEGQSSLSGDKLLLEALIRLNEPASVETNCLPALLGTSDPTPFLDHPPSISRPLAIPCAFPQLYNVNRAGSGNEEQGAVSKRAHETLGEALCHSQTRARQAENVAARALDERERIVKMLFREAWILRTYKQWIQTLEFENMWLRENDLKQAIANKVLDSDHVCALPKRTENHLKKQQLPRKKVLHGWASDSLFVGYTIGLAFALGLSFAGAGLVIGWRMGWISIAC